MTADQNTILLIGETETGDLMSTTREVARIGRHLADKLGGSLHLVFLGEDISTAARKGYNYGADRVYLGSDPLLDPYIADAHLRAIFPLVKNLQPTLILMPHNDRGLDLAPRLAYQLGTKAVLDCEDIALNSSDENLTYIKPVFGGKALGHFQLMDESAHIITIREGAFEPADCDPVRSGEVESLPMKIVEKSIRVRFVQKEPDENLAWANKLQTANIVVAAGRGIKDQEGVELATKAADILKGAIAGSRPVVDNGWLPYTLQIGLTGKKVHPQFYIAAGISGAIQHVTGCLKSRNIVAINNDEGAPIFKMSRFGVVGDAKTVLKGFIEELCK